MFIVDSPVIAERSSRLGKGEEHHARRGVSQKMVLPPGAADLNSDLAFERRVINGRRPAQSE